MPLWFYSKHMISTHILDTSLGHPATGVTVQLGKKVGDNWTLVATEITNLDGRISFSCSPAPGSYRLLFQIEPYFIKNNITPFFTAIPVTFDITDTNRNYHVPLLLNPYGYSTYRGS